MVIDGGLWMQVVINTGFIVHTDTTRAECITPIVHARTVKTVIIMRDALPYFSVQITKQEALSFQQESLLL